MPSPGEILDLSEKVAKNSSRNLRDMRANVLASQDSGGDGERPVDLVSSPDPPCGSPRD